MKRRLTRLIGVAASAALAAVLVFALSPFASAAAGGAITGTVDVPGYTTDANVVVYLVHVAGTFAPERAKIDQRKLIFHPHVLPIVEGSTVTFFNDDSVPHNVFSPNYERYNLGTWKSGQSKSYTFKHPCKQFPCVYDQLCLLHQEMEAYVVVLQNPYFAVTDGQGHYTIANVPAGTYRLAVWRGGKMKCTGKPVTVAANKTVKVDFTLHQ